jgi:hypothetical protein
MITNFELNDRPDVFVPLRTGIEKEFIHSSLSKKVDPKIPYRSLVMKTYWVARSYRPTILYACVFFARFMDCYTHDLYNELCNFAVYIRTTKTYRQRMVIEPHAPLTIHMQSDSDFAGDPGTSKSTVGGFIWINDYLIFGDCTTMDAIVTSSAESEMHGIFEIVKHARYFHKFLSVFTVPILPCTCNSDNDTAVLNSNQRKNSKRNRHWDVQLRYVHQQQEAGFIKPAHIPRAINASDMLTHSLPRPEFERQTRLALKNNLDGLRLKFYHSSSLTEEVVDNSDSTRTTDDILSDFHYSEGR